MLTTSCFRLHYWSSSIALDEKNIRWASLNGKVTLAERSQTIDAFQDETDPGTPAVPVITNRCGTYGLTLAAAWPNSQHIASQILLSWRCRTRRPKYSIVGAFSGPFEMSTSSANGFVFAVIQRMISRSRLRAVRWERMSSVLLGMRRKRAKILTAWLLSDDSISLTVPYLVETPSYCIANIILLYTAPQSCQREGRRPLLRYLLTIQTWEMINLDDERTELQRSDNKSRGQNLPLWLWEGQGH